MRSRGLVDWELFIQIDRSIVVTFFKVPLSILAEYFSLMGRFITEAWSEGFFGSEDSITHPIGTWLMCCWPMSLSNRFRTKCRDMSLLTCLLMLASFPTITLSVSRVEPYCRSSRICKPITCCNSLAVKNIKLLSLRHQCIQSMADLRTWIASSLHQVLSGLLLLSQTLLLNRSGWNSERKICRRCRSCKDIGPIQLARGKCCWLRTKKCNYRQILNPVSIFIKVCKFVKILIISKLSLSRDSCQRTQNWCSKYLLERRQSTKLKAWS